MLSAMPACLFCEIARGERPAHIVTEAQGWLAVLDHRPVFIGHCLVLPADHVETLLDLPAERAADMVRLAQRIAAAQEQALGAEGSFVATNNRVSQSVPHLHVHVVPRRKKDGLKGFFWPRMKYGSDEEMGRVASALREALR